MKVLEKLKNKKVFALYLLGVLVLSVGVSFAYFSSTNSTSGSGGVADVETATVIKEGLISEGNVSFSDADIYPGHKAIASIRVTGTGNNIPKMFHIIFNGNNTFKTPINYTIYKTESNIDASYDCSVKVENMGTSKIYYEECTGNNIESLGTPINTGTITQGEGKTTLKSDEIILTEPNGREVYYYVVFEYPNEEGNQNDDIGSTISGNINIEEGNKYQEPSINMIASSTAGSNGWYKSVNITTNVTTQTGKYSAKYCITTSNGCTPDKDASLSGNSFEVALSSNASPQKVCVRVTDEYNQTGEGCSEAYSVDGNAPTSNVTIASSTNGSNGWYQALTLKANGSDSHSKVASIRYCTTTSSSCTPSTNVNGSSANVTINSSTSSQRVCAQAIDNAGNISAVSCSNAYNVDTTNPTVSITSTSVTKNSISVTVSGRDSHSKIYQYKFSNNGGSSYTTVTSSNNTYTYTFNNLNSGTSYNIAVQSVDRSGRTSSKVTKNVTTEKGITNIQELIANYSTVKTRTFPFTTESTVTETTTGTIYKSANSNQYDNDGEVYYFAGNPTDNWVKWAGFYWRIIRINGNGSIRMIYQGTSPNTTGSNTELQTSTFNDDHNRSEYVGLKYTTGSQHGTGSNSTIMGILNTWYNSKLASYADDIDTNVGFCSDRNMGSGYSWSSQPSSIIHYAAYDRVVKTSNSVNPSFKCSNTSDILKIPVGLITVDETVYAGLAWNANNTSNYLYTNSSYWTMSPYGHSSTYGADVFYVYAVGNLYNGWVVNTFGVRPVVNLKSSVQITGGNGSSSNPYVIS